MLKKLTQFCLLTFALLTVASMLQFSSPFTGGILDISSLYNYENQGTPNYINAAGNKDNTTIGNDITNIGATLGRVLFYDKNLSSDNTVSCATCHQQEFAFGDPAIASQGVNGTTGRHSMRLINARYAAEDNFFWDERAATLEQQTTQPIQDHTEMGFSGQNGAPDLNDLITKLENIDYYDPLFTAAFGDAAITEDRMQRALAQFIRSIESFDSQFDENLAQVFNGNPQQLNQALRQNFPNFSATENRGKALFLGNPNFNNQGVRTGGGLGCQRCHAAPEFDIAPNSRNNGMVSSLDGGTDNDNTRSPSLRDFLNSNGTVHSGSFHNAEGDLAEAIEHYNSGINNVPNLDNRLRPGGNPQRLNMTQGEKDDLAAFLRTLTGSNVYTDEKWADPFSTENTLHVVDGSLPLTFSQLLGQEQEAGTNLLHWQASNANQIWKVTVERSETGDNFVELEEIFGIETNNVLCGEWVDEHPFNTSYYRLIFHLEDGTNETSTIVVIENNFTSTEGILIENNLSVYPNPTHDILHLQTNGQSINSISIFNINGQLMHQQSSLESINMADWAAGFYFLRTGEEVIKVVKK